MYVSRSVATCCVQIGPSPEGERMCGSCRPEPTCMSGPCSFRVWPLPLSLHLRGSAGCGSRWLSGSLIFASCGNDACPFTLPCSPTWSSVTRPEMQLLSLCPSKCFLRLFAVCDLCLCCHQDTRLRGLGNLCGPEDLAAFPEGTQHWEREPEPDVTTVSAG